MNKYFLFAVGFSLILTGCNTNDSSVKKIDRKLVSKMTIAEKARFVIGTGMAGMSGDMAVIGSTQSIVPGAAGTTYPLDTYGIPAIVLADGPAGLRIDATRQGDENTYYCTHFPIGTLLASTWNTIPFPPLMSMMSPNLCWAFAPMETISRLTITNDNLFIFIIFRFLFT